MSNRLEQFIRDNREQFDTDTPTPQVWNKVEQRLFPATDKRNVVAMKWLRWSVAAAVLILAGLGTYWLVTKKSGTDNPVAQTQPAAGSTTNSTNTDELLNEINPTYAKEVYHFTQLIELKQTELKQLEKENPSLYKRFLGDINKLDSSYNALKKELPVNPNREQLLEAMIQNLRLQTELLNQQLQIIQQINQSKQKGNESTSKNT